MINPSSPVPLHIQIRKSIEQKIKQGLYEEKIPSERELMETYDVSRSTVREAISQLVIDGILEKNMVGEHLFQDILFIIGRGILLVQLK